MKKIASLIGLIFGLILLSACSSTDNTKKDSSSKTLSVALEENTQPLSYTDSSGKLTGYEVDVLKEINKTIKGYKLKYEAVSAESAEVGLESGTYDAIGGGLFKTEEREKKYLFPKEYTGVSTIEIYKRKKDKAIQSLDDLVGKKLSPVTANGGIYNLLTKYNNDHPQSQIKIPLGESGELAKRYQGLADGTYDAVIMPSNFGADKIIKSLHLDINTAKKPVQVNATYFLISKKNIKFKKAFDKAAKKLRANGTLSKLSKKWFGEDMFKYKVTEE
ncbi:transporter substrate-binding domain-containing protein [Streptococcus orisasini]